jgi:RecA/RadA recombinase
VFDMADLSKEQKLAALKKIVNKNEKARVDGKTKVSLKFGSDLKPLEFVPSGILDIDQLCGQYQDGDKKDQHTGLPVQVWTGKGGPLVMGKWNIWWGGNGCGKTTMALRQNGKAQEMGKVCGYFNAERMLDPIWAAKQGVNLDELVIWEGGDLEENLDSMIDTLDQGLIDVITIDTIHAFGMKADRESGKGAKRGMQDEIPQGRLAAKLSRFFRVATNRIADANCGVLLIGQARQADDWEQLTGGHALKHYVTLNLHFTRLQSKTHPLVPTMLIPKPSGKGNETVLTGFVLKITVDKTKINHKDQSYIELPFLWGLGPDNFEMNVLAAVKMGIIQKAGSFYTLPTGTGDAKLQGKQALMDWMKEQPAYYEWLLRTVTSNFSEPEELAVEAEVEDEPEEEKTNKRGRKKRGK